MSWVIAGLAVTVAVAAVAWAQWRTSAAATLRNASPRVADDSTRALDHITEQADRLARGEPPLPTDEPAAAAAMDGLYRVSERFQQMTDARVHIVATERDLDRARAMYRSILPLSSVAKHGRLHIAGASMPAAETGGDWWTYRKLTGGRLMVVVGDATGHGVYSAMIGCAAHGAVEALSHVGEERLTPTSVLRAINAAIRIPGADRAAMTCFAALIDSKAGTIDFANASHMLPLLATTDETGTVIKVGALTTSGGSIDRVDDSELIVPDIREGSQKLAPGEVVVMFTDGLTDRRDKGGRAFGHRRLQQALGLTKLAPSGEAGITAVRDRVLAEVATFADGVPSDDDVTLVVCALDR